MLLNIKPVNSLAIYHVLLHLPPLHFFGPIPIVALSIIAVVSAVVTFPIVFNSIISMASNTELSRAF